MKRLAFVGILALSVITAFVVNDEQPLGGDIVDIATKVTLSDTVEASTFFKDIPEHTVDVSSDGKIDIKVSDKTYSLIPKEVKLDKQVTPKDTKAPADLTNTTKDATVKDIYGVGTDIKVSNTERSVTKVVSFTETYLATIPKGAEFVEVSFDMVGDWTLPNGIYTSRIEIEPNVWMEKSLAWDSSRGDPQNDIPNGNYTDISIEVLDGVFTKRIPVSWLKTASFPIYTDATFTFGTKALVDTGVVSTQNVVSIGTDKYVQCWIDNADASAEGQCVVATVSGTTATYGSVSDFTADAISSFARHGTCAAGTDRWVVTYSDDADLDDGTARVATSTGTTINGYGPEFDFLNGVAISNSECAYVSTDRIIIAYDNNSSAKDITVVACNISATQTLTCGVPVIMVNGSAGASLAGSSCASIGTDKFVCMTSSDVNFGGVVVGTISGTSTITLGTEKRVDRINQVNLSGHNIVSPANDKFVLSYARSNNASIMALGTVSGTTITLGATTTVMATSTLNYTLGVDYTDADSGFMWWQEGLLDAGATKFSVIPVEFNFTSRTFSTSTSETINTSTDVASTDAVKIGDCKYVFVWEDNNDTGDLFSVIGDTAGCEAPPSSATPDNGIIWY